MKRFQIIESGKNNKKVIFLLAGWQNKPWMYWPISKILTLNGFYCITYTYNNDVFSPNTINTVRYFKEIRDDVLAKTKSLDKESYKDLSIFGTSLGSAISLMVVNKTTKISKIILNTTGADIAETVWQWDRAFPSFKESLISQSLTLNTLKKLWSPIAPLNNIDNLNDKKVLIYLSKKDEIIPYEQGKQLVKEFKKRNYKYNLVINNKLNHFLTGVFNLINATVYLSFLKE